MTLMGVDMRDVAAHQWNENGNITMTPLSCH